MLLENLQMMEKISSWCACQLKIKDLLLKIFWTKPNGSKSSESKIGRIWTNPSCPTWLLTVCYGRCKAQSFTNSSKESQIIINSSLRELIIFMYKETSDSKVLERTNCKDYFKIFTKNSLLQEKLLKIIILKTSKWTLIHWTQMEMEPLIKKNSRLQQSVTMSSSTRQFWMKASSLSVAVKITSPLISWGHLCASTSRVGTRCGPTSRTFSISTEMERLSTMKWLKLSA